MRANFQMRTLWVALGLFSCVMSDAEAGACQFTNVAQLPITWAGEAMQPAVAGSVNGKPVLMLFDTGLTLTSMTRNGVAQLGLPLEMASGYMYGASGVSNLNGVHVRELTLGAMTAKERDFHVISDMAGGVDYAGLIGADFSMQMDMEMSLSGKSIKFFRTVDCADVYLGYWDKDGLEVPMSQPGAFDRRPHVTVELNGKKVEALVDSGASRTVVFRKPMEAAGIVFDRLGAEPDGFSQGIGKENIKSWRAKFNFKLGDEIVTNAKLGILDDSRSGSDEVAMLIGQDWLRAHRVLFAKSQKKMVFSYLGGDVFPKDNAEPWYMKDAEEGLAIAQYALANDYLAVGNYRLADIWMKKAAAQGEVHANFTLGRVLTADGKYAEALPYLRTSTAAQPADGYIALWLYLAEFGSEGESAARKTLAANAAIDPDNWPSPLVRYYLGQSSAAKVLAAAGQDALNACMASYYLGKWSIAHGEQEKGEAMVAASKRDCDAR